MVVDAAGNVAMQQRGVQLRIASSSPLAGVQAPRGCGTLYPDQMLRRRCMEKMWRDASVRHGFERSTGRPSSTGSTPSVRRGIVSEIFGVFRGRMRAGRSGPGGSARAPVRGTTPPVHTDAGADVCARPGPGRCRSLQSGSGSRTASSRAAQRGRLRFLQWNCDIVGMVVDADAEVDRACCVGLLESMRAQTERCACAVQPPPGSGGRAGALGVDDEHLASAFVLLDRRERLGNDELEAMAFEFGLTEGTSSRS